MSRQLQELQRRRQLRRSLQLRRVQGSREVGASGGAGGLLLLGVGVMLLMMYVTGRLEWLFAVGRDANALRAGASSTDATAARAATSGRKPSAPAVAAKG